MTATSTVDRVFSYDEVSAEPTSSVGDDRPRGLLGWVRAGLRGFASAAEWVFGVGALVVGLSILAAVPIVQFLSFGYLLEVSARVARTGRLRDGFIGVRKASRIGRTAIGIGLCLLPIWLIGSFARSAELIDPGSPQAKTWRLALGVATLAAFLHIVAACARDGRFRRFVWPVGGLAWLVRGLRQGRLYQRTRDDFWAFVQGLRLPYYFRLGLVGFLGTLAMVAIPATLIAMVGRYPLLGLLGMAVLAILAPWLPFAQVRYAVEGKVSALFRLKAVRDRYRRAPWAFAFALLVVLLAAIPLYLLKIEMVPREAAWLPGLVFVIFLAPARFLVGWAYHRSGRRDRPRHWTLRVISRLAILPTALLYVVVVFLAQYTSWGGLASLYEQHAFLLPVPFLNM